MSASKQVDGNGACSAAVPGTLMVARSPDRVHPRRAVDTGTKYRLTLVSGSNTSCDAGEMCGLQSAASFDPLNGTHERRREAARTWSSTSPATDRDEHVRVHARPRRSPTSTARASSTAPEVARGENAAALKIAATHGCVDEREVQRRGLHRVDARAVENCQYLQGAMPTAMGDVADELHAARRHDRAVVHPGRDVAAGDVRHEHQMTRDAPASASRTRHRHRRSCACASPRRGPITGYIFDKGGTPTLQVALALYMDAPDMSDHAVDHDLHSQAAAAHPRRSGDVPRGRPHRDRPREHRRRPGHDQHLERSLGSGAVDLVVPKGQMKLQLISPPVRGAMP